ncbi:MAG: N-acetylmuramoyl-L-alanine amidase [Cognaticolwellia sp.]|jgi:N-acetylmuramoyl-L-alanine amidase
MKHLFIVLIISLIGSAVNGQVTEITPELSTSILEAIYQESEKEAFLPKGAKIDKITMEDGKANIYFLFPFKFLKYLDDEQFDEITELIVPFFTELNASEYYFFAKDTNGDYQPLGDFLPSFTIPEEYNMTEKSVGDRDVNLYSNTSSRNAMPPSLLPKAKNGALENKTIWVSAGHGWRWHKGDWRTQRTNANGIVEDFGNIEAVNYYLLKYLENAGANVWTVRERDMNTNEIIVDDENTGFSTTGKWSKSSAIGHNKNYEYIYTKAEESGRAIFTPTVQESGYYWVSVFYRNGNNRCQDTRYHVYHAGGESVVSINQEVHGMTWVYLGQYYFEKGTQGRVELSDKSSDVGQAIIADAVRFGGGMGTITGGGNVSGKPRYEEAATYYTQYQGFNSRDGDVAVRPEYAEWELAKGTEEEQKSAIYVSWHTNAGGGKGTGTESFIYNRGATSGSLELTNAIHKELVGDIRAEYDDEWKDRGVKKANFGELRRLRTIPGALIEIGFHDNEVDAEAILTPEFRNLSARAVYQGIVRYYANQAGIAAVFLPESPTHLMAQNQGNNQIKLTWQAPLITPAGGHAATGYKVYMSKHGKGFADGIAVNGNVHTISNLEPETTYYFKVTATNAGGESFATTVIAARTPKDGSSKVAFLLVDGFDRLDRYAAIRQNDGKYLGFTKRLLIDRMNRYDYSVEYAKGLEAANVSFDGTSNESVQDLRITLKPYQGVCWFLGEESTADASLDVNERTIIRRYLDGGGGLIISGSEHAFEMARSSGTAPWFFQKYLKAQYAGDDAQTYNFAAVSGSFMNGIKGSFDNSENGYFDVDYPDQLRPVGGAKAILTYSGGKGGIAGIAYNGRDFKVVNYGFPLETVTDESVRNELIVRSVKFILGQGTVSPVRD